MFFKLKDTVLFRRYPDFGYLADNHIYSYQFFNDDSPALDEKYVSASGAVMLDMLNRIPQNLDDIVRKLLDVFVGVERDVLSQDTFDFFMQLVGDGYLSCGESFELCNDAKNIPIYDKKNMNTTISEHRLEDLIPERVLLRSVLIDIASACNERCVHCFIPHRYKNKFMNADLFYRIIEDGRAMNIINVTLTGGEPLLHPDFLQFLGRCLELDLSVNVLSNLTLLNDDIISVMKRNPLLSVQTSLYSMDAAVHDSITQVAGSFEKTKAAVLKLCSSGIPVQISCPIMKQNKDSFCDVINWGKLNHVSVREDYVIFGSYDHSNSNLANRLTLEEVEEAFDKQVSKVYIESLRKKAQEKCMVTGSDPICSVCRHYFCVSVEGDVFPCAGWQTKKIGDLKEHTLKEIWEDSPEIRHLREIKRESFPQCVACNDRGYCTVCLMTNSNEDSNGDMFNINRFHCEVASLIHSKVDSYSD